MSHRPHPKPYDDVLQTTGWTPLEANGMADLVDPVMAPAGRDDG